VDDGSNDSTRIIVDDYIKTWWNRF
jgi:hypothetical protein